MFPVKSSIDKTDPPAALRETLPTMYDLPSEDPEEPGLPDEFHYRQPPLLSNTFRPPNYEPGQVFSAGDMNIYYDVRYYNWYKRPDWFGVVGVPQFYDEQKLRLSYVIWQEGVSPFVLVELLSPGTEGEDLGETEPEEGKPPTKWEVYEQILQVPYYVTFNRYNDQLRVFALQTGRYQELELTEPKIWMPELALGLGLWQGEYEGCERLWLRWYDAEGNWILTEAELAKQQVEIQRQRAEEAEKRAEYLAQRLRELGIEP